MRAVRVNALAYADDLAALAGSRAGMALNGWVVGVLGEFMTLQLAHAKTEYLAMGGSGGGLGGADLRLRQALALTTELTATGTKRRDAAQEWRRDIFTATVGKELGAMATEAEEWVSARLAASGAPAMAGTAWRRPC